MIRRDTLQALLLCLAAVALLPGQAHAQAPRGTPVIVSSCTLTCHGQESKAFAESVHAEVLDCIACHGGDPTAIRDADASHSAEHGFRGVLARRDVPGQCAECHADPLRMAPYGLATDQLAHYVTSAHGRALASGNELVAVCTDCHGAHGILSSSNPRAPTAPRRQPETCGRCHADADHMRDSGLPTDLVARFARSIHGQALLVDQARGAPSCADCHGSHGAAPPGVDGIVQVCGHCHQSTHDAYRQSPHASIDMSCGSCHPEQAQAPGYQLAGCAACHGAHDVTAAGTQLVEGDEPGRCEHCHRGDGLDSAFIDVIEDGTARLRQVMQDTQGEIERAKLKGLFLPNETIYLRESGRALVSIGPLSHALDVAALEERFHDGVKRQDRTLELIAKQRDVARDRRLLAGGLGFVLLMLAGLLAVKLGQVRRLS